MEKMVSQFMSKYKATLMLIKTSVYENKSISFQLFIHTAYSVHGDLKDFNSHSGKNFLRVSGTVFFSNPLGPLQSIIGLSIILLTVKLLECAELFDQFIKQTGQHFTRSHCHHRLLLIFLIWIERHILSPFCHYIELNCCDSHEL